MPNIRLITAKPGPSGPTLTAEGFGAPAARGLQTLGQGIGEAASQLNQIAQAEKRIKDAKDEQLLRERIAQAQVALDEARFQAEEEVPSDADRPGQKFTQIVAGKTPKTLQTSFEDIADSKLSDLRADLQGESLDRFEAATGIFRDQSVLRIRGVQRARDIDSGRAAFVRTEETLMSLASDPNTDLSSVLSQHAGAADAAVDTGLYKKAPMALVKKTFRQNAQNVHDNARFLIQTQAATDELMGLAIPEKDRIKLARQLYDGKFEEKVVKDIKLQSDEETASLVAAEKEATNASWTDLRNGSGKEAIRPGVSGKSQIAMDSFITKRAKEAAKGGVLTFTTDPDVFSKILALAGDTTPEGVAAWNAFNLLDPEVFTNLSRMDSTLFDKLQQRSRNGQDAGPDGQAMLAISEVLNGLMDESGVEDEKQRKALRLQVIQDAQFFQEENGRKPNFREQELIASKRIGSVNIVDAGFLFFDKRVALNDLTADQRQLILDDPDVQLLQKATEEFKRRNNNQEPTVAQVTDIIDNWLTIQGVPGGE